MNEERLDSTRYSLRACPHFLLAHTLFTSQRERKREGETLRGIRFGLLTSQGEREKESRRKRKSEGERVRKKERGREGERERERGRESEKEGEKE
jgi:E3 ubiquitin-protein ligase RBBP6